MIHVVSNIERRALHARHFVSLQFQTNPTALQSLKLTIARRLPYLHLFLGQGEPAYCAGVEGTPGPLGATRSIPDRISLRGTEQVLVYLTLALPFIGM